MFIEIGFTFQSDKASPVENSWTYFYVKGDDITKAKTKAKAYFKKFCTELGWTKKTKLTHIEAIRNATKAPDFIIVSSDELPPPKRSTSTPRVPTRKKSSGNRVPRVSKDSGTRNKTATKPSVRKRGVRSGNNASKDSGKTPSPKTRRKV